MIARDRDPNMPAAAFFELVYLPMKMIGAGAGTIQQYRLAIGYLSKHLGRDLLLSDLSESLLADFMQATLARGLSPVTANMRVRYALTLWRYALRKGYLAPDQYDNPGSVDLLKVPKRLPVAWTIPEMEQLIEACRLSRGRFMGVPAGAWWTAFVLVLYDTGLRRAAAIGIQVDELDLPNHMLKVPPERMKNRVEQYFRLHPQTIEAILETFPPRRQMLFPWPFIHHRSLYGRFKRILKRAGLPYTKRDLFHKLRRTTASHLARLVGESLAIQQLGHQDASTIKRYIDPRFTANHDAARMLPRPSWTNPREVMVEVPATVEPELGEPLHVRIARAELVAEPEQDVFARLVGKDVLTPTDIREAIFAVGMTHAEFAKMIGLGRNRSHLTRILSGKIGLSPAMDKRIRSALGLTIDRNGDAFRAGEKRKAKGGAK